MVYRMGSAVKAEEKNTTLPIGVSERITIMKFHVQVSKSSRVTIISLYINIYTSSEECKERFYEDLYHLIRFNPASDQPVILGDLRRNPRINIGT